jgi:hypothetical protein
MNWEQFAFPAVIAASVATLYIAIRKQPQTAAAPVTAPAGAYAAPPSNDAFAATYDAGGFTGAASTFGFSGPQTNANLGAARPPNPTDPNLLNTPYAYYRPTRLSPPWEQYGQVPNTLRYPLGLTAAQAMGIGTSAPGSTQPSGSGGCGCGC